MLPILLTYWTFLETLLKRKQKLFGSYGIEEDKSIQRNILSTINALGTILLGATYIVTKNNFTFIAAILYPIVFYIYDTFYIWFNKKNQGLPYIIHHLAAIYYLQCIYLYGNNMRYVMLLGLISIEISNLPLYYVYNFLKTNKEKNEQYYNKLLHLKKTQLGIYGFFRILIFGYIIFNYTNQLMHQPILISSIYLIFLMGAYWLQHQVKGFFKTKNEYDKFLESSKQ